MPGENIKQLNRHGKIIGKNMLTRVDDIYIMEI